MSIKKIINNNWLEIINEIDENIINELEKKYNKEKEKQVNIFPYYKKIFNFTNYTSPENIKVIIIGQDCYHGTYINKENKTRAQAHGIAFSVPKECKIPPSLKNIYENLLKYKHINKKPDHGNLKYWSNQGVLLLNTSLTVEESKPNSHKDIWKDFTDKLIEILSQKYNNLIFLLWGREAYNKLENSIIKNNNHYYIISSHPSPLSVYKKLKDYDCFMDTDHFGKVNNILKKDNKSEIDWNIN